MIVYLKLDLILIRIYTSLSFSTESWDLIWGLLNTKDFEFRQDLRIYIGAL